MLKAKYERWIFLRSTRKVLDNSVEKREKKAVELPGLPKPDGMNPMHKQFFFLATIFLAVALAGCSKPKADTNVDSNGIKVSACTLLSREEIESIQGEALRETKSSERSEGGFSVSHCYLTLMTASNSIALTVTRKGNKPEARDPRQFWEETFSRGSRSEKASEEEKGREEEEKSGVPVKIAGLGDEAFWMGNGINGALYVLKGNSYMRIGIGGSGDQATKIAKSKTLAQIALKHL